jgi:predicted nucleotidyltransferase
MRSISKEEIAPLFRAYPFIAAAYQFGSTVRDLEGPLSDLDEQAPSAIDLLRIELLLAYELQKQLTVSEVDLIALNGQRIPLQYTVLRTGWLIYEADPKYRIRFTQRVVQDYLDFQPTLELIGRFHTRGRLRRCGIR